MLGALPFAPKKVCVALSGGADSVCLLHILKQVYSGTDVSLSAVHINHCLRGKEADNDEAFCVKLCNELNVPITVHKIDVKNSAQKGESIELAARRIRYEVFDTIDADFIAKCSRDDILAYITDNGLSYVTDSSNLTNEYTRNKFRHNVVEPLKEIAPEIVSVATRNMEQLGLDNDFIEASANELFTAAFNEGRGLKTELLLASHRAVAGRVLIKYAKMLTNRAPDSFHINLMLDICRSKNASQQLFDGYTVMVNRGYLHIEKSFDFKLLVNTEVVSAENFKNQLKINKLLLKNSIDYDKIVGKLVIRTRLSGDTLRPLGRGLSKPLRKLQNEVGLEKSLRDFAPVAVDDNGPFWSYELGIDERMSIDENTKNILIFNVYKQQNGGN